MKRLWDNYSLSIVLTLLFLVSWLLQVVTFVWLSKNFIHKDSPQSRDSDDRVEAKIDALHSAIMQLHQRANHLPPVDDPNRQDYD